MMGVDSHGRHVALTCPGDVNSTTDDIQIPSIYSSHHIFSGASKHIESRRIVSLIT